MSAYLKHANRQLANLESSGHPLLPYGQGVWRMNKSLRRTNRYIHLMEVCIDEAAPFWGGEYLLTKKVELRRFGKGDETCPALDARILAAAESGMKWVMSQSWGKVDVQDDWDGWVYVTLLMDKKQDALVFRDPLFFIIPFGHPFVDWAKNIFQCGIPPEPRSPASPSTLSRRHGPPFSIGLGADQGRRANAWGEATVRRALSNKPPIPMLDLHDSDKRT